MRPSTLFPFGPLTTTLALTFALALSACGSTVTGGDDDGEDGTGGSGATGSATGTGGGETGCADEFRGDCEFGSECIDGEWRCQPCPPDGCQHQCPATEPVSGTACPAVSEGETCEYPSDMDCGPPVIAYTCEGGAWSEPLYPYCLPPLCRDMTDASSCEAQGCRWLEPGCGDDPIALPAAGCFDAADCTADSCWSGDEICMPVTVLPDCVDEGCDACGMVVQACVPQVVGG